MRASSTQKRPSVQVQGSRAQADRRRWGIVSNPAQIAADAEKEASGMTVFEDYGMERVRAGASSCGLHLPAGTATKRRIQGMAAGNGQVAGESGHQKADAAITNAAH